MEGPARLDRAPCVGALGCNDPPQALRIDRRCASDSGINQSRHSRRIVPITRSEIALAFGLCGGDLSTVTPRFLIDSSRLIAKMLSRS
jgi:hypothetical protein